MSKQLQHMPACISAFAFFISANNIAYKFKLSVIITVKIFNTFYMCRNSYDNDADGLQLLSCHSLMIAIICQLDYCSAMFVCFQMELEATVRTKSCTSVVERCVCSRSNAGGDDDVLFPVRLSVILWLVHVCSVGRWQLPFS